MRQRHSRAFAGNEEPQSARTKGKEKHAPLVPDPLCVRPEQPLLVIFLRGNPLNVLPPSKPKAGDAGGGSPGGAPSRAGCSEGSWTRRWLPMGSYHGSRLIPPTSLAPGARQKRGPPRYSFCCLLIDSSCQRLFALGRPSGRRGRGGLGRNRNSSAQEVDCVSFIFTKGEGKSLRRVFPGRK